MPRVAHTVAAFCERPIAKALGIGVSITRTRGLGRSACTHRRSMIPCSSGSCAGVTSLTPSVAIAILSEREQLQRQEDERDRQDRQGRGSGGDQRGDEDDVDEAQQEDRERHPRLQTGVLAEARSL